MISTTPTTEDRGRFERTLLLGEGVAEGIPPILRRSAARRVFCVADANACRSPEGERVMNALAAETGVSVFSEFEPNPTDSSVLRSIRAYREAGPDAVIAIGGGTAIDVAKLTRAFGRSDADAVDLLADRVPTCATDVPLVAVPTTAGSGAEATKNAVVYVDGVKRSIAHPGIQPDVAVVDPLLCHSLPPAVTASSGLDAFCQAIESIWSVGATDDSISDAAEALRLAHQNLYAAFTTGSSASRTAMSRAAHLAGRAINVTSTTACHALSYTLTSERGIPHGAAVAATLTAMLRFNAEVGDSNCQDPRGPDAVRRRLGVILGAIQAGDVEDACRIVEVLVSSLGYPPSLRCAGVQTPADLSEFVAKVNAERLGNNPRSATHDELIEALSAAQA